MVPFNFFFIFLTYDDVVDASKERAHIRTADDTDDDTDDPFQAMNITCLFQGTLRHLESVSKIFNIMMFEKKDKLLCVYQQILGPLSVNFIFRPVARTILQLFGI